MVGWGDKIGKYLLREKLGQGGMGVVYLAVQEGLDREVALKMLPEEGLSRSKDLLKRFMKEVSVCSRLSHPHIIKIYDYGVEQGVYYYAMEVLRATSLEQILKETPIQSVDYTLRIAREMASAMAHYHPLSIVHRDIKPANIMLDEQGKSILTDFGLVKDLEATGITRQGAAVGTPYYMAPEQIRAQMVDGASDIYQLGVVLFRMLTGRMPFEGATPNEVFGKVLHTEAPVVSAFNPNVPIPLENVIVNCLEKERKVRYRSAEELTTDLALSARRANVARRHDSVPGRPLEQSGSGGTGSMRSSRVRVAGGSNTTSGSSTGRIAAASRPADAAASHWPGRAIRIALLLLLLPAAFGVVWLRGRTAGPPAIDLAARAGARRAIVEWQSPWAYSGQVEWGEREPLSQLTREPGEPSTRHSLTLGPLLPGRSYRYRVRSPNGAASLEYTFETPAEPLLPEAARADERRLSLGFRTPNSTIATLAGPGGSSVDPSPRTSHLLELSELDPFSAPVTLSFDDPTGERIQLDRAGWREAFARKLTPMAAAELTRQLGAYDPVPFLSQQVDRLLPREAITGAISVIERVGIDGILAGKPQGRMPHYLAFEPGDRRAADFAARIGRELQSQPFQSSFRLLRLLAPGLLSARTLPAETAFKLAGELRKLTALDYYAAFIGIPFITGANELLGPDLIAAMGTRLSTSAQFIDHTPPGSNQWAHPMREFDILHNEGWDRSSIIPKGTYDWRPTLEGPARWKRAEISLMKVRMEPELFFRVTVNRLLALDFRTALSASPDSRRDTFDRMSVEFDPRALRDGVNEITIDLIPVPGTRYLGLKRLNRISSLRLSWQ